MKYPQLTTHSKQIAVIARLEMSICLIVYFPHKYCSHLPDSTMTTINKIYLKVLAPVQWRANLIRSLIWTKIQPVLGSVSISNLFLSKVGQDLSNNLLFCKTTTYHQFIWGVP
jgi:hypothetical protein